MTELDQRIIKLLQELIICLRDKEHNEVDRYDNKRGHFLSFRRENFITTIKRYKRLFM